MKKIIVKTRLSLYLCYKTLTINILSVKIRIKALKSKIKEQTPSRNYPSKYPKNKNNILIIKYLHLRPKL